MNRISIHHTSTTLVVRGPMACAPEKACAGPGRGFGPDDAYQARRDPRDCREAGSKQPGADKSVEKQLLGFVVGLLTKLLSLLSPEKACEKSGAEAKPDRYPLVPEVSGTPDSFRQAAGVLVSRVTGSDAARQSVALGGNDPRANGDGKAQERVAVWWALQKNPDVKYDADKKVFYTTRGGQRDQEVARLDEVIAAMGPGGTGTHNASGMTAIASLLRDRVAASR